MLTPLLFAALAVRAQEPAPAPPTASGLISKMFARYNGAKSLGGTIHTTQVASQSSGSATVATDTNIAYERPSKMRLEQRQRGKEIAKDRSLVSDGNTFAYTPPDRLIVASPYLVEKVQPEGHEAQTVGDLYNIVASDLPDRSPVLDAIMGRQEDLRYFAKQLDRFRLTGKETVGGKATNVIEGDWRESEAVADSGQFKLYVTDDGDLVRYVLVQKFGVPTGTSGVQTTPGDQVVVTTTWDAAVTVNVPIRPDTFVMKGS